MIKPGTAILLSLIYFLLLPPSVLRADGSNGQIPGVTAEARARAVEALRHGLVSGPAGVRPLAASYLTSLDYHDGVAPALRELLRDEGLEPDTRLNAYAALAQAQANLNEPDLYWLEQLRAELIDAGSADRGGAVRALSGVGSGAFTSSQSIWQAQTDEREAVRDYISDGDDVRRAEGWGFLLVFGEADAESELATLLFSSSHGARIEAARLLGRRDTVTRTTWDSLLKAARSEPEDSGARVYIVAAALKHAPGMQPDLRPGFKAEVRRWALTGNDDQRAEACRVLAEVGDGDDVTLLTGLLDDDAAGPRTMLAAAYALCRIDRRHIDKLGGVDWGVIALYGLGMICIGWFYSKRNSSAEDYLLGGRGMRPWTVGLSMFATLLSTISYLSYPGEVIRYGPMILSGIAVYPLIFLVVGYCLIPFIMKLRVTSAYEILETRLGLSIRMLGGVIFLSLRLLWMATIIFVTTSAVIIPMLNWDVAWTPLVCAVLGVITVIYTSMGGLRAVVFTDVIQTCILFGGAILTMVLISVHLGGVGAWWPDQWLSHWPDPTWTLDTGARISFVGMMIAMFTWYVCTSGSDQMAIQRYLATRDARTARRVLLIALASDAMVAGFLILLGLALLAYYTANPHMLPDGQTMVGGADMLFTRYIAGGLPIGVRGLVIAGLLAAAMSSLSSGVNSSSSVIAIDFIERFQKIRRAEPGRVMLVKLISCLVGAAVVALSLYVSLVPGNIVELAYRVVNLLVAPLFLLFFLAMFVPWATATGAWCGAAASSAVAILIAYWEPLSALPVTGRLIAGLRDWLNIDSVSFLWIMPGSLLTGILFGSLCSLLPIGKRRGPVAAV